MNFTKSISKEFLEFLPVVLDEQHAKTIEAIFTEEFFIKQQQYSLLNEILQADATRKDLIDLAVWVNSVRGFFHSQDFLNLANKKTMTEFCDEFVPFVSVGSCVHLILLLAARFEAKVVIHRSKFLKN